MLLSVPMFSVYKNVLTREGVVRWIRSHFHDCVGFNFGAISIQLLAWGRKFSDFWGKKILVSRNSK